MTLVESALRSLKRWRRRVFINIEEWYNTNLRFRKELADLVCMSDHLYEIEPPLALWPARSAPGDFLCLRCAGTGSFLETEEGTGKLMFVTCPDCKGEGFLDEEDEEAHLSLTKEGLDGP